MINYTPNAGTFYINIYIYILQYINYVALLPPAIGTRFVCVFFWFPKHEYDLLVMVASVEIVEKL